MKYLIGVDQKGEQAVNSIETQKQIDKVKKLECALVDSIDGSPLAWDIFDDPKEPRTIFQAILADRRIRIDDGILMADRPLFAVITEEENRAIRLEYYEGHDALELIYDVRALELKDKNIPNYMDNDPQAYDPVAFLEELMEHPYELAKLILEEMHKDDK